MVFAYRFLVPVLGALASLSAHAGDLFAGQTGSGSTSTDSSTGSANLGACSSISELAEEDQWLKKQNCKKMDGGGGGDSGSGGDSSSGGSSGSGGGGGGGGGKCAHVTAVAKGGGLVSGGGYEGRSEVIEKSMKKYGNDGLELMQKACGITGSAQTGSLDDAQLTKEQMTEAMNNAMGAKGRWGNIEIELEIMMPLMKSFPDPLAPMAKKNDQEQICKDDEGCKKECGEKGDKLKKVSQECVDNLQKMIDWAKKKQGEAQALADAMKTGIDHAGTKLQLVGASPSPASTIVSPINPVDDIGRGAIASSSGSSSSSDDSSSGSYSSDSSYAGGSGYADGASERSSNSESGLEEGGYTDALVSEDGGATFATNNGTSSAFDAAVEEAMKSVGSGKGGSTSYAPMGHGASAPFGVSVPGYPGLLPSFAVTPLMDKNGQSGNMPVGKNIYALNSLTMAKEQPFLNPKTKRPDVQLRALTAFERITRRHFGPNGERLVTFQKWEKDRKMYAGKPSSNAPTRAAAAVPTSGIKPASLQQK